MAVTCSACGYDKNPDGTEFCDACGSEISDSVIVETPEPAIPEPITPAGSTSSNPTVVSQPMDSSAMDEVPVYEPDPPAQPYVPPVYNPPTTTTAPTAMSSPTADGAIAKLTPKQAGAPIPEFVIDSGSAIVGIFDPDTGPVEIDLEGFAGDETVSRNHAEIYQEGAMWKVKDLGSTNGVFIKPAGQSRFASRITSPTVISSGDEVAIAKVRLLFQTS